MSVVERNGTEADGGHSAHADHLSKIVAKVTKLHGAIDFVCDPAVELILKRKCADVGKVMYTLRANGDLFTSSELETYDELMRDSLGRTLGGDVSEHGWMQATCGA